MTVTFLTLALLLLTVLDYAALHEDSKRWHWFKRKSKAAPLDLAFSGLLILNVLIYIK
ncbi:hypothetical protein [Ectobacillus ponti]|uniref:Uncharacterized protein n=1 Tax=Ectobacillus ponti TaxID=2961894 RepID=A0AA42BP71_9BACI|nr:hypothetical protein [Ectobacillus ponti]MCP8968457.1 hypothetical protein [Ectobacillus ponti]